MSDDPIDDLLQESDQPTPAQAALDVDRIIGIARRRRLTRQIVLTATPIALVLAMAIGWQVWFGGPRPPHALPPNPQVAAEEMKAELEQLRGEANWREQLALRLAQRERKLWRSSRVPPRFEFTDPGEEVEYAAFAMVHEADRMLRNPDLRASARQVYLQVLEDFPRTRSAQVARQRLSARHDGKEL